jgi:hypothetical protein
MEARSNQVLSHRPRQTTSYCNLVAPIFFLLLEPYSGSVTDGPDFLG